MPARGGTLSVAFHLTHACNLRCTYCYTGEKFARRMAPETADRGVDFALAEARRQGAEHLEVVFFGGEPLLEPELLCRVADRATAGAGAGGLRVSFKTSTNGVLLTEPVLRDLARRRVFVSISLDGDPAIQDRQRPDAAGRGSAARLGEAIDRLLTWNPCANVTCVLTPDGGGRADASVDWLFERGFRYISTTLDYGAPWTRDDLDRLSAAYRRMADRYVERTLAGEKVYVSALDERIRTWTRGPLDRSERCAMGVRQFSVAPSGRLYPCVQFVREDRDDEWAIGNVASGFDEGKRRGSSCEAEAEKAECDGCALSARCSSWCACVNWQTTGRVDRVSPIVCEHDRILLPIADDAARRLWRARSGVFLHKMYNPAFPLLSFAETLVIRHEEVDATSAATPDPEAKGAGAEPARPRLRFRRRGAPLEVKPVRRMRTPGYPSHADPDPTRHPTPVPYPYAASFLAAAAAVGLGALFQPAAAEDPEPAPDKPPHPFTVAESGLPFRTSPFGTGAPSRLDEAKAREVISRVFAQEGYRLSRDVPYDRNGVAFIADGYDAEKKVGFVFATHKRLDADGVLSWNNEGQPPPEAKDPSRISLGEAKALEDRAASDREFIAVISHYDRRFEYHEWSQEVATAHAEINAVADPAVRKVMERALRERQARAALERLEQCVREYIAWARSQGGS